MRLILKNIGKVKSADVLINGITVIAGENDTGKSTVGKALYSVFNSFYKVNQQINNERIRSAIRLLDSYLFNDVTGYLGFNSNVSSETLAENIVKKRIDYAKNLELLKKDVLQMVEQDDTKLAEDLRRKNDDSDLQQLSEALAVKDEEIFSTVLMQKLNAEFSNQINNIFSNLPGKIILQIQHENIEIQIENNHIKEIYKQISLRTEALYIDDSSVLENTRRYYFEPITYLNHRDQLTAKLQKETNDGSIVSQIITENKLSKIYGMINTVCSGNLVREKRSRFVYKMPNSDKELEFSNVSAGLKTFVILKTLLQNGTLEQKGTIILDEPEVNLHPEWQIVFAELIVLIQKEFEMHILVSTHSPYFLRAIEVYAAKYGIADKCNFYMATMAQDNTSILEEVTSNTDAVYQKLLAPFQKLENEMGEIHE